MCFAHETHKQIQPTAFVDMLLRVVPKDLRGRAVWHDDFFINNAVNTESQCKLRLLSASRRPSRREATATIQCLAEEAEDGDVYTEPI